MDQDKLKNRKFMFWLIWAAMLGMLFVYLGLAVYLGELGDGPDEVDWELVSMLLYVFAAVSVLDVAFAIGFRIFSFFRKLDAGEFDSSDTVANKYFRISIITWVLVEAVAIYGFVLFILSYELNYYLAFMAPALVLMVIYRPKLGAIVDRWRKTTPQLERDDDEEDGPSDEQPVW